MNMYWRFPASCFVLLFLAFAANAAVYTVTKTADTSDGTCDADCSLREAVLAANATAENDIIIFSSLFASPQTITLSGTEILFANNGTIEIHGPGANRLTVSGNNTSRIFRSAAGVNSTISGMRLTGGNGASTINNNSGGAVLNDAGNMTLRGLVIANNATSGSAGGVRNSGTNSIMTVDTCIFANNSSATSSAGGIQNFSTSTLTVVNSTFTGNTSGGGSVGGGGIQANGSVSVTNSTFSGNTSNATGGGGAINSNGSFLLLTNVTITRNTSSANGGGLHRGSTTPAGFIRNSIIAGNNGTAASPDVTNSAGGLVSEGSNIIGIVGTSTGWIASDLQNVNPLLSPLGFHGGFGMTHLLLAGSPSIDAGQNCVVDRTCTTNNPPVAVLADQRGAARPAGATVDIGAVEASGQYSAVLPSAAASVPYNFTLVPANNGFTYTINSGGLGGLALSSSTPTTVSGTAPAVGAFNALVQIVDASGQAFQNYRVNVLADPNVVSVSGQVVDGAGRAVKGARVTFSAFGGSTYSALTNGFGYFRFDGIPAGLSGQLIVKSKLYSFDPKALTVADVVEGVLISPTVPPSGKQFIK